MLEPVLQNPWVRAAGVLAGLVFLTVVLYLLTPVLVPLFFAFIAAYVFNPLVDALERKHVPRMAAVVVLVLALVLLLVSFPLVVLPGLIFEAQDLIETASQDTGGDWLEKYFSWFPLRDLVILLDWAPPGQPDFDERAVIATRLGEFVEQNALRLIQSNIREIAGVSQVAGASAAGFVGSFTNWIMGAVFFLANFALFVFVAVFLLHDYHRLMKGIDGLIPPRYRRKVHEIMHRIDVQLRSFLRGQLVVCFCLGIMYAIGFNLSGIAFALPLAIFGGVASFVPYVGPWMTVGPAALLALLQYGVGWPVIGVLFTVSLAQALEGNVLTPKIVGSHVGLNPVWVILAILVFSKALGFVGLLLAVPLAAVLKVIALEAVAYYKRSPLFEGKPSRRSSAS